jgi:large subunit ribosomal protein L10
MFLTNFQGLTVAETNGLRSELRNVGTQFKVLKNTLVRLAYNKTDVALLADYVVGPRGAAWTDDEGKVPAMAKVLVEFAKGHPQMELVRGVVGGQVLDAADMEALSKLPSRTELLGKLLGTMIAPVGAFVSTLAAVPRSFLTVLKAIEESKNAAAESAAV